MQNVQRMLPAAALVGCVSLAACRCASRLPSLPLMHHAPTKTIPADAASPRDADAGPPFAVVEEKGRGNPGQLGDRRRIGDQAGPDHGARFDPRDCSARAGISVGAHPRMASCGVFPCLTGI